MTTTELCNSCGMCCLDLKNGPNGEFEDTGVPACPKFQRIDKQCSCTIYDSRPAKCVNFYCSIAKDLIDYNTGHCGEKNRFKKCTNEEEIRTTAKKNLVFMFSEMKWQAVMYASSGTRTVGYCQDLINLCDGKDILVQINACVK